MTLAKPRRLTTDQKLVAMTSLVKAATVALNARAEQEYFHKARKISESIFIRQKEDLEKKLTEVLEPMFKRQIDVAASELEFMSPEEVKSTSDQSHHLSNLVFHPSDWDKELIDRALPVIAVSVAESMMSQTIMLQNDLKRRERGKSFCPTGPGGGVDPTCSPGRSQLSDVDRNAIESWSHLLYRASASSNPSEEEKSQLRQFNEAIEKLPHYSGTVFRSLILDNRDQFIDGKLKKNEALRATRPLSSSKDRQASEVHSFDAATSKQTVVVLEVRTKTAADISHLVAEEYRDQKEVVLRPGSSYVVSSVTRSKGDHGGPLLHVQANEVAFNPWVRDSYLKKIGAKSTPISTKATTATDWLADFSDEDLEDVVFSTPYGDVTMRLVTEFPEWMKKEIVDHLEETFSQPYWSDINETTGGDINQYLKDAIIDGKAPAQMAKEMAEAFGSEYPKSRGLMIARTESGNALNGARTRAIESLVSDLGMDEVIKRVWHSVLGNTTRDSHAHLDGVPADKDGRWSLGGVRCRWPGDVNLPVGERVNCQCTVVTQFGMTDATADELIAEYELRQLSKGFTVLDCRIKNCGIGPGGFQPGNTCARGSSSFQSAAEARAYIQSKTEMVEDWKQRRDLLGNIFEMDDYTKDDFPDPSDEAMIYVAEGVKRAAEAGLPIPKIAWGRKDATIGLWNPNKPNYIQFHPTRVNNEKLDALADKGWLAGKSPGYVFLHELGHYQSHLNKGLTGDLSESEKLVASKVSQYATTNRDEFIAEVFSSSLVGKSYDADVLDLYHTLNGPSIPER